MKFFVAHILKGEAGEYQETITRAISEQFGTEPIHLKLPPHITIVPPFDWGEPHQPIEALKDAVAFIKRGTFYTGAFDHFHTHTIFLSIVPSKETADGFEQIRRQFKIFQPEEQMQKPDVPHASVARFLSCNQFSVIWKFLEKEDPDFQCDFDSVSLLAHINGKWVVVEEVSFK